MTVKILTTKKEFDDCLKDNADKLVVVDFHATWCGPCKIMAPYFKKLAEELTGVVFAKVDVDENEETAGAEDVTSMPTFKLYKNGEKVDELIGASEKDLKEKIDKHR